MKEVIKEIDRIIINVKRDLQFSPERRFAELFNKDEINKLLDYITNLQEENERLKQDNYLLIDYQDMEIRYNDYKSRIDKALEYIKGYEEFVGLTGMLVFNLKMILKGEDK